MKAKNKVLPDKLVDGSNMEGMCVTKRLGQKVQWLGIASKGILFQTLLFVVINL